MHEFCYRPKSPVWIFWLLYVFIFLDLTIHYQLNLGLSVCMSYLFCREIFNEFNTILTIEQWLIPTPNMMTVTPRMESSFTFEKPKENFQIKYTFRKYLYKNYVTYAFAKISKNHELKTRKISSRIMKRKN